MRVVIDTNAWLSRLLINDSVTAKAIDRALIECEILVSDETVEELADVLSREKFDRYVSLEDRQQFIRRLVQVATIVPVLSVITECRDPKDDKFLALALDSESDCIVSGDRNLLALNHWRGIEIVSPASLLPAQRPF